MQTKTLSSGTNENQASGMPSKKRKGSAASPALKTLSRPVEPMLDLDSLSAADAFQLGVQRAASKDYDMVWMNMGACEGDGKVLGACGNLENEMFPIMSKSPSISSLFI